MASPLAALIGIERGGSVFLDEAVLVVGCVFMGSFENVEICIGGESKCVCYCVVVEKMANARRKCLRGYYEFI